MTKEALEIADLQPGDVLLFKGDSLIARAIRLIDGGDFNHAALYLGEGSMAESTGSFYVGDAEGVVRSPLQESVDDAERTIVRRLKRHVQSMEPVLNKADDYLEQGGRYAYEQILLLVIICLTRKIIPTGIFSRLLRRIIDITAEYLLKKVIDGNKEAMICSEFVYRCYDEALPPHDDGYTLRINSILINAFTTNLSVNHDNRAATDTLLTWAARHDLEKISMLTSDSSGLQPSNDEQRVGYCLELGETLDGLIEQYFDEVKKGQTVPISTLLTPELLSDIRYFATAYLKSSRVPPAKNLRIEGLPIEDASDVLKMLVRTSADFVTPADLQNCADLFTLGEL